MITLTNRCTRTFHLIRRIGYNSRLDDYDLRKLAVFNILNFFGLLSGLMIPLAGLFNDDRMPPVAWVIACSPFLISTIVLWCNFHQRFEMARLVYFVLYPVLTSIVYTAGVDAGIELFFLLYGVLAVFFLQRLRNVIVAFSLSMALYCLVSLVPGHYAFRLSGINYPFFLFNHVLAIIFIFYALFLVRNENRNYQLGILYKNRELHAGNLEIEEQARQLRELNTLKNKLFSVIAHDLKGPMYALRNLFRGVQQYDLPAEEIKMMIPDVVNDLNYTTGLMDNLLQWAKSQMKTDALRPEQLELTGMIREVTQLLRLQADAKKIHLAQKWEQPVYVFADRDMISLVLRNLLSNAIKFTPEEGQILVGAAMHSRYAEVFVSDSGAGISQEQLRKIDTTPYYTTNGTANEAGTGLGLMLCREFLAKNGGSMSVQSEPGKGSTFSFTLPLSN